MSAFLPKLDEVDTARDMVSEFRGYNHNLRISFNEFHDMKNMSGASYPVLTPRKQRGRVRALTKPNGLFAHDKLCWADGTGFYYDGMEKGEVADSKKQFVSMGAFVLIFPDKKYYNTQTDEFGNLEQENVTTDAVTCTLCKIDGTAYVGAVAQESAPDSPADGDLWIDTSGSPHVLKQYADATSSWIAIPTVYVKIECAGIGAGLSEYDGVTISGMENDDLNGEFILHGADEGYIIVAAIIDATATQTAAVTVTRSIPDMDYFAEHENRVWGCSSENHEIYACKLGDPKNWNSLLGLSTDSYAATVGTSGDFTGICTHLGNILFFKEDVVHELQGNKPSNFQLSPINARGVEDGSAGSLCVVNEVLYYKSRHDVCAYGSSLPVAVSEALGSEQYKNAHGGACGSLYYLCMEDYSGRHHLFVYDTVHGFWHKEDDVQATNFAAIGKELYFINEADRCIYSVNGNISDYADEDAALEPAPEWYAVTSDIGIDSPDSKYVSKVQMRVSVDENALVIISVQYNDVGEWEEQQRISLTTRRSFSIPIFPRRCDTMRIRISGKGGFALYTVSRSIQRGSDAE